jgi:8-oxo-dGTP diphosphatase
LSNGSADAAVPVHVAVAVLRDAQGRVLLSRRPEHVHQGGLWEFPGGKLEPEEGILQALAREAREELGVEIVASYPLIRVNHRYPDKNVLLDVHMVTSFTGTPHGREGQPLAWVGTDEFGAYPMPAADHPIINAIRLPEVYLITGDGSEDQAEFLGQLEEALCRGCRLVQLRRPELKRSDYLGLAEKALTLCRSHNAELLLKMLSPLAPAVSISTVVASWIRNAGHFLIWPGLPHPVITKLSCGMRSVSGWILQCSHRY